MKTFYRICFVCCLCVLSFLAGIGSFVLILSQNKNIFTDPNKTVKEINPQMTVEEVTLQPKTADLSTQYFIREVNTLTGEEELVEDILPQSLVGRDRESVEHFLTEYNKAPSLKDKEKGFVSAQLQDFSPEKIIIEKIYKPLEENIFYLKAEENFIVVYYSDLSTVYMYTDIIADNLPEKTQAELSEGKKIVSLESLYSFLESHTS